jgi:phosphatidylglycerophosphate synthase
MAGGAGEPAGRPKTDPTLAYLGGSVALSGATAWLILIHHAGYAGLTALLGALALLAGALSASARDGLRGAFAERVADRAYDAAILAPLAWVSRAGSNGDAILALVGLGASYVASYERAKGRSLGYRGTETMAYRAVRIAILVLVLLTGAKVALLGLFALFTLLAAGVRAWNVANQERHGAASER